MSLHTLTIPPDRPDPPAASTPLPPELLWRQMHLGLQMGRALQLFDQRVLSLMANSFFSALVGIASAVALIKITFGA